MYCLLRNFYCVCKSFVQGIYLNAFTSLQPVLVQCLLNFSIRIYLLLMLAVGMVEDLRFISLGCRL